MDILGKPVDNRELGQLRSLSEADIQRSIEKASRTPSQEQHFSNLMGRMDRAMLRLIEKKEQELQKLTTRQPNAPAQAKSTRDQAARSRTGQTAPAHGKPSENRATQQPERHKSATDSGYRSKVPNLLRKGPKEPEHVAIRRSIQSHIQRNMQREARREKIRDVGRQVRQKAAQGLSQIKQSAKGMVQSVAKQPVARTQQVQSEQAYKGKTQSMEKHREKGQERSKAEVRSNEKGMGKTVTPNHTPARQKQQQKGKEQDRGRTR